MINNTKQDWKPGQWVKVGFLTLQIVSIKKTPGDGMPDVYVLQSAKQVQYEFTPHFGLKRL